MHELQRVINEVNWTHARLGPLIAFGLLCAKARKCLMIVAPAGTGKSTATKTIARLAGENWTLDSVTRSGLRHLENKLSYYGGLIVIDDLGKVDTQYSRLSTVTTFAELVYSGFVEKYTVDTHIRVEGFAGGAVMNVQPVAVGYIMASGEWESVIMDKTVRWYHLYRPIEPNDSMPEVEIKTDIMLDDVVTPERSSSEWYRLSQLYSCQWSDARLNQHLADLLRASAAWDGRKRVNTTDYELLDLLVGPLRLERYLLTKTGFEVGRYFDLNLLAMLVELASWPTLTVERVCRDYKVGSATVYRIIEQMPDYFRINVLGPNTITIMPKIFEMLEVAGVKAVRAEDIV